MNSDILEKQINQEFEQNLSTVKFDDPFRAVKIKSLESLKNEESNAFKRKTKKPQKKGSWLKISKCKYQLW